MTQAGVKILTEGPIFKQLIKLAAPIMATNFVQITYNLVDIAWVGRLGSEEAAAVSTVGLLTWFLSAIALLTKVAAEITVAQSVGARRIDEAQTCASHAVTLSVMFGITCGLVCFFGSDLLLSYFHLNERIEGLAGRYLQIVAFGIPFTNLVPTFAGVYNGCGRTSIPFYLIVSGLIGNMLLDPIFIYGLGMGTDGAAVATVLSQTLVFALFVWQMKRDNGILNRFPYFIRPRRRYVVRIIRLGLPITLMNLLFSAINITLARFASLFGGHLGILSQTVGGNIEGITWNTSHGVSTALGTFVAQNVSGGRIDRVRKGYRYALAALGSLGVVITVAFLCFGREIFGLFVPDDAARMAGGDYLFIAAAGQVFTMLEITTMGAWNGYGRTIPPSLISIVFNLVRIPLALFLAARMGINGVWLAITISCVLKGVVSGGLYLWKIYFRK